MSTPTSQQFEGETIEEALAAAVEVFGDNLEVLDAQRVRRRSGIGRRRKERYEVTASSRSLAEPKDFEQVLQRMAERVDEAERELGVPGEDRDWWQSADFVLPERPKRRQARSEPVVLPPEIEVDVRDVPARQVVQPADVAPAAAPAAAAAMATATAPTVAEPTITVETTPVPAPNWSIAALEQLGLPSAMIGRLPAGLDGDLRWVEALSRAIGELLDTAQFISGPCELTGHGAESAVQLIRGACDGFRLDSLIIDGRRVPATPLELALAIRSLLREPQS